MIVRSNMQKNKGKKINLEKALEMKTVEMKAVEMKAVEMKTVEISQPG
ncbi:MAG: hypothetical protein RBR63_04120 [Methanosarcina vacuolata]|nr:hypothetical protein [Methanosarcina vacuolata]